MWIWTIYVILVIIVLLGLFAIVYSKKNPKKKDFKYPEGHYVGLGIALGVAFGLALNNLAIGIALGVGVGIAIEASEKKKGKIRPMNSKEKKKQLGFLILGLLVFVIGVILYFFVK